MVGGDYNNNTFTMAFNLNTGYGQVEASLMGSTSGLGGKVFVVATSTSGSYNKLIQAYVPDYDGEARFFSTVQAAVTAATANRGDMIFVAPGYTETITSAGGLAISKAGVSIIGLGNGADRPTFTFSTATTASITVTGAGVSIKNIVGVAGINALANPINVTASNVSIDMEWQDGSSSVEAARAILATSVSNLTAKLKYVGFTNGSSCVNAVRLVGVTGARLDIDSYGLCSTGWVEFLTTASTNVVVKGTMYTQGITNYSRDVVDTVTGSKWSANLFDASAGSAVSGGSAAALAADDISAVASSLNVPTADSTANTLERDVIGNKTDAAANSVTTTTSIAAYVKGLVATLSNVNDYSARLVRKNAATLTNGMTLFTVTGGPIMIEGLYSVCTTPNDATASTLQYSATPTVGSATTISGASASLANAAAGASVSLAGTALSTAALYSATGPNLIANPGTVVVPAGTITAVVGVGSTTGTWTHYMRYLPLATAVNVT